MITNLLRRGLPALALAALPLLATAAPATADGPATAVTLPAPLNTTTLFDGIDRIPAAAESRDGYVRTAFKHWNAGAIPDDGCNTRAETLLQEAVDYPEIAPGCKLTGGRWFSLYDDTWVTAATGLDVDHLVPLAESWDSGASTWTAKRREAYANDLASPTSLIAVTAKSNRAKADKDPAEWLPPAVGYHCTYVTGWVETKLRWSLTADDREREALLGLAEDCPGATVSYETVPFDTLK
ncbi:HNH endonuclease family protein [Streptomyces sp. NPDC059982]|uniref:HNH endonuclease family protein n=1 Tax=unclassified Streptomyces TaxID=2593676 RepID=UPI003696BF39